MEELAENIYAKGRLSWNEYFITQAILVSNRSPSDKLRVGCLVTSPEHRIRATGYNGFFAGTKHEAVHRDGHEINTVHAELNAIADAARHGIPLEGGTLYVSHYPCINCTKAVISAGIACVYYYWDYKNDPVSKELFNLAKIPVICLGPKKEEKEEK